MNQIAHCDWLSKGQDGAILLLGTTRRVLREKFPHKPNNKSFIEQDLSVEVAGYWPSSLICEFMDLNPVLVHKHTKKNFANIQPSSHHTWSITHIYIYYQKL